MLIFVPVVIAGLVFSYAALQGRKLFGRLGYVSLANL